MHDLVAREVSCLIPVFTKKVGQCVVDQGASENEAQIKRTMMDGFRSNHQNNCWRNCCAIILDYKTREETNLRNWNQTAHQTTKIGSALQFWQKKAPRFLCVLRALRAEEIKFYISVNSKLNGSGWDSTEANQEVQEERINKLWRGWTSD